MFEIKGITEMTTKGDCMLSLTLDQEHVIRDIAGQLMDKTGKEKLVDQIKHGTNVTFTEVACCTVVVRETVLIHKCVLNETYFQNKGRK